MMMQEKIKKVKIHFHFNKYLHLGISLSVKNALNLGFSPEILKQSCSHQ